MDYQNHFPYFFNRQTCKTCRGNCCRGLGGYVWISRQELLKMAGLKKMDPGLFSRQYVRQVQGRLSLKEHRINGEHLCCFLDSIDCRCTIYQARPTQCRAFPFWSQFRKDPDKLFLECPGVFLNKQIRVPEKKTGYTGRHKPQ